MSPPPAPEASRLLEIGVGLLPLLLIFAAVALAVLYLLSLQRALERCSPASRRASPDAVWLLLIPLFNAVWHFFVVSWLAKSLDSEFKERNLPVAGSQPGKRVGMAMCVLPVASAAVLLIGWIVIGAAWATRVVILSLEGTSLALAIAGLICWIAYWVSIAGYSRALGESRKAAAAAAPGASLQRSFPYLPAGIAGLFLFLALSLPSAVGFLVFEASGRAAEADEAYAVVYPHGYSRLLFTGEFISRQQVSQIARQQLQRQYPQYAGNPMLLNLIERQAGQHLVQQQILLVEAGKLGIRATRGDVDQFLHQGQIGQVLYPNGQYIGDAEYARLIAEHFNLSVKDFEDELKSDIVVRRLDTLITAGVVVSDAEVRDTFRRHFTRISFDYAVISADDLRGTINPSDSDLEAFFRNNAAPYATAVPEQRRIAYFAFTPDQLPGGTPRPSQQEVQQYYAQHQSDFTVPEQARSRHILIQVRPGSDASADAAARAKAEGLLKQIEGGASFADLARKYSDDPGSKDKGGELGFARRGMMVPAFDNAIFTQKIGDTQIVKTQFGYHIVQVEERQAAHTQPINEVLPSIEVALIRQKLAAAEENYAQALTAEAAKNGLEKTAAAHRLELKTTPPVDARGLVPGFADSAPILAKAFQSRQGGPPQYAPTGEGYAIFQVTAIAPAHAPSFADWKSHILDDYRAEQLPGLLGQKTRELAEKAKAEGDLARAAKEMGATLKSSGLVGEASQAPDLGQLGQAAPELFDLKPGDLSGPIETPRGGVVAKILDKQEPPAEEIEKNLDQLRDRILDQRRSEAFNVFLSGIFADYKRHHAFDLMPEPKSAENLVN